MRLSAAAIVNLTEDRFAILKEAQDSYQKLAPVTSVTGAVETRPKGSTSNRYPTGWQAVGRCTLLPIVISTNERLTYLSQKDADRPADAFSGCNPGRIDDLDRPGPRGSFATLGFKMQPRCGSWAQGNMAPRYFQWKP
jgi:hypothetical protein